MVASRSVFYGFGAFVGQYTGLTTCGWWPQDPATLNPPYDTTKLVPSDIGKNPQLVRTGGITASQIQADDSPAYGGLTKIGPQFPGGSMTNGCWLESNYYNALPSGVKPSRDVGLQCYEYELKSVLYWTGPLQSRKFYGFYASIQSEQGTSAMVSVWNGGTGRVPGQQPAGTWWLDLAAVAHPIESGFTAIGTGIGNPKIGALFLDSVTVGQLHLERPKLPPSTGSDSYPMMP
jgi:hypothetical protein